MPSGVYVRTKPSYIRTPKINAASSKIRMGKRIDKLHFHYNPENFILETRICTAIGCEKSFKCIKNSNRKYCVPGHQNKNKSMSEEAKEKNRIAHVGKISGEKHWNWQGGKASEEYPTEFNPINKKYIRTRDNHKCQLDVTHANGNRAMDIHHIDYNKKNCDPSNLIALCRSCNAKVNGNREYWTMYFENSLSITQPYS
jgi:hypothetical protein